ncbi:hypothetical protein MGG_06275 [Pyricularia oryzae 70-15]|uniref:Glycosyl transferase CAP10 domain-containing protein n=3 Tax=Pyricularia oryzae TaxID=318829 RepID=G4N8E8_PYRO7|nr:uncharacterized protein MGG_06275 [Pyricularia oryzae 70-15]EHA50996.1 hypothetical protein MGG_06275 [Pyricularia oryzae 70-15]ELQ34723.1 hypothetical protein OOU_Y34scaffold00748g42 [Pyricularia oryzae Y34]KAI7921859.1 hypothetical protein M0657_005917 [Pyricularia oryzae]
MGILRSRKQQCFGIAIVAAICTLYLLGLWTGPGRPLDATVLITTQHNPSSPSSSTTPTKHAVPDDTVSTTQPAGRGPKPAPPGQHPVSYLIGAAEAEMKTTLARQSKTLRDAVAEYRRRHDGLPPPPNFDKWWEFARAHDVQLVDEFDGVADLLTPFWGLRPATIRGRAAEALGFAGNLLLGVQVRAGKVAHISGGNDWHRKALSGMMASFVEHLPDMDLAFNVHDEPRVVVPHDDMARLVARAAEEKAAAAAGKKPRNSFAPSGGEVRPAGLAPEGGFDAVGTTRFNTYAHQSSWLHSRASCAPGSAARILDDSERVDDVSQSLMGELGFVYNATALSDVCASPSLATSFGLFERPNAYSVVQELFPIFSASKVSSYADILHPAPWYWYEKVAYDEAQDPNWESKKAKMYWRGSTTGGYSRNGGWKRHHRQRMVDKLSNGDSAKILEPVETRDASQQHQLTWQAKPASRSRLASLFDVFFSHVGQCDPADCDEQERHFTVKGRTRPESAWHYRHLLDVDGNAFSGRFYAFLQSRSLVYKLSIFREWHADWLKPWVHYVPMSLRGDDWAELVRYFSQGGADGGDELAEKMALRGREWAAKVLRNEDLEVWFFRLLLEYGRVVDDDRKNIGYLP